MFIYHENENVRVCLYKSYLRKTYLILRHRVRREIRKVAHRAA